MSLSIGIVTLASDDLARALRFYRDGMGLKTQGLASPEAGGDHVLFALPGGLSLVFIERAAMGRLSGENPPGRSASEVSLSHIVQSRQEVDALLARAFAAGARQAGETLAENWGYHGQFLDPDNHLWEIVWFKT